MVFQEQKTKPKQNFCIHFIPKLTCLESKWVLPLSMCTRVHKVWQVCMRVCPADHKHPNTELTLQLNRNKEVPVKPSTLHWKDLDR